MDEAFDREPSSVLMADTSMLPTALLDKLRKLFIVENSENLPPYTFSFLTSKITVMLFDYSYYFKKLSVNDTRKEIDANLARLTGFASYSEAPYILFLGHKVEEFLPSFIQEIIASLNEANPRKSVLYGFSTSWKDVAIHLLENSEKLGQGSLEKEESNHHVELECFLRMNRRQLLEYQNAIEERKLI